MPLEANEIKDNVGKVYLLKSGLVRDPLNLDSYHPLSSTDGFMPHLEDGVPGNIVLASYKPDKKATWASHWFPLWYRGLVEKQITGEGVSRTFAQYFSYLPILLSAMNKNGTAIMDVEVTIVQYTGDNLLGGYATILALETAYPATEELNLGHSVGYVYDSSDKGFYTSQWNTEDEVWEWTKVTMPVTSYGVQMKQYNTFTIKVQRGFAPTDSQYNITWTDEQIRLTWQEIAYLEETLAEHTELLEGIDTELLDIRESLVLATENDWNYEAEFPNLRFGNSRNGWVQVGSDFYVFGGTEWLPSDTFDTQYSNLAFKYNALTREWTELEVLPIFVNELRCVYHDGYIYLFGMNVTSPTMLDKTYRYKIADDTYELISNPPDRIRVLSGAVLIDDDIYVMADMLWATGETPTASFINTTPYVYNITSNTWTSVGTPTDTTFDRGFSALYDGKIYVQRSLKFQSYDPVLDTWDTTLTPPTYGNVHTGLMQVYQDRLFIGSGWQSSASANNPYFQYYNVEKDKWYVMSRLEVGGYPLGYGSLFLYNDKFYYIGGYSNETSPLFNTVVRSFNLETLRLEFVEECDLRFNTLDQKIDDLDTEVNNRIGSILDGDEAFNVLNISGAQLRFNATQDVVEIEYDDGTVGQLNKELWAGVRNENGSIMLNGEVVAVNGVVGQQMSAVHADPSDESLHFKEIGVVTMTDGIAVNAVGKVTRFGEVNGIPVANFEVTGTAYAENQELFVSVNGKLTNVKVSPPIADIHVGWVLRIVGSTANIFVDFVKVPHLDHLSDVSITSGAEHDILIKNASGVYVNSQRLKTAEDDIDDLEEANMVKTVAYNTSSHVLTLTYFDGTTSTIDLPLESAIVSASYDNDTKDITFTLQSGSTLVVPLDDIISGLASEDWVTEYFIAKTQIVNDLTTGGATDVLSAEQGKQLKIIADGLNGDIEALDVRVDTVELNVIDHEVRLDSVEGALRKQDSDVANADDDGLGIVHLGKDVAETAITVKVDGLLLNAPQLVTNGDFSNGTTGWASQFSTSSVALSILSNTGDGTNSIPRILRTYTWNNEKYYINVKVRITNTSASEIRINTNDSQFFIQSTPIQNTWYKISNIFTYAGGTTSRVQIAHFYADSETANGKVMEVDYVYAFNISTLIANKQYSPIYNTTFDLMSDEQIKAQMDTWVQNKTLPNDIMAVDMDKRVTSQGKQLFDKSKYATDYAYKISVKPSTQYTWSISALYKTYDKDMNEVSSGTNTTLTVASNVYYIAFIGIANIDTFQLEQNSVATTYENYRSTSMYLDTGGKVGYSLPNGVKDTIEFRNGKAYYVQRVKKYMLQASDVTAIGTVGFVNFDTVDTIVFNDVILSGAITNNAYVSGWIQTGSSIYNDNLTWIGHFLLNTTSRYRFIVAKGTYANLASAQSDLAGTDIYYQLATPIETEIAVIGNAMAYPNGTFYIEDMVRRNGVYNAGITVDKAILTLDNIYKLNDDGSSTKLSITGATVAGDGLSFTHTSLSNGDFVWFDYFYRGTNVKGLSTVYYYGDKMIVADSVTGTVYKIIFTVASGTITVDKVAV